MRSIEWVKYTKEPRMVFGSVLNGALPVRAFSVRATLVVWRSI